MGELICASVGGWLVRDLLYSLYPLYSPRSASKPSDLEAVISEAIKANAGLSHSQTFSDIIQAAMACICQAQRVIPLTFNANMGYDIIVRPLRLDI